MKRNKLKVYLAAMFSRRYELRTVAEWLTREGFEVVSQWIYAEEDKQESREASEISVDNCTDLSRADVLIQFAEKPGTPGAERGGRHVELGLAIAWGKSIILVGEPENIFQKHPSVLQVKDLSEAVEALEVVQ